MHTSAGHDEWSGQTRAGEDVTLEFNGITEKIGISAPSVDATYFLAPSQSSSSFLL